MGTEVATANRDRSRDRHGHRLQGAGRKAQFAKFRSGNELRL